MRLNLRRSLSPKAAAPEICKLRRSVGIVGLVEVCRCVHGRHHAYTRTPKSLLPDRVQFAAAAVVRGFRWRLTHPSRSRRSEATHEQIVMSYPSQITHTTPKHVLPKEFESFQISWYPAGSNAFSHSPIRTRDAPPGRKEGMKPQE